MQAAASSASILLEYLESLGPIVAHTTGSLEFPERFFDLLRLLKGKTFRQFLAAQNLRKVLRDAKSWHQIPFQGRQQLIRALVSEIMAALRVFLEACAAEGSPVATKGGRTFWAP